MSTMNPKVAKAARTLPTLLSRGGRFPLLGSTMTKRSLITEDEFNELVTWVKEVSGAAG